MHHPILLHHNNALPPQDAQHNNNNATQLGIFLNWCHLHVCAELNGNVASMCCAPFMLTEMLSDVNHWLMGNHGVIADTHAHGTHLMVVIGESQPLHYTTTFLSLFILTKNSSVSVFPAI